MITKIFILIPTYNERENIESLTKQIFDLGIPGLQVVIIDDNSSDGTGKLADKLAGKRPIKVIHRPKKLGIGSAYLAGFQYALANDADLIFQMDADLSHDPKDIPRFLEEIENGFDVIIGSRRVLGGRIIGWNWWRHFCSQTAMALARFCLGLKTRDVTSGFRCYQRKALEKLELNKIESNGYSFLEEIIYLCEKNGFRMKEIPITFYDRQKGKSKVFYPKEVVNFFITILRLKLKDNNK